MDIQRQAFEEAFKQTDYYIAHGDLSTLMLCDDQYALDDVQVAFEMWQAAQAQAVPEGFVLIKDDTKTVVAIERMVEQQVEASGMDSRRLERLDGWKIIEAAVKTQEPAND